MAGLSPHWGQLTGAAGPCLAGEGQGKQSGEVCLAAPAALPTPVCAQESAPINPPSARPARFITSP